MQTLTHKAISATEAQAILDLDCVFQAITEPDLRSPINPTQSTRVQQVRVIGSNYTWHKVEAIPRQSTRVQTFEVYARNHAEASKGVPRGALVLKVNGRTFTPWMGV